MEEGRRGHCRKRGEGGGEGANGCGLSDGRSFELFEDGRASLHKSARDPSSSLPLSLLQNIREREGRELLGPFPQQTRLLFTTVFSSPLLFGRDREFLTAVKRSKDQKPQSPSSVRPSTAWESLSDNGRRAAGREEKCAFDGREANPRTSEGGFLLVPLLRNCD